MQLIGGVFTVIVAFIPLTCSYLDKNKSPKIEIRSSHPNDPEQKEIQRILQKCDGCKEEKVKLKKHPKKSTKSDTLKKDMNYDFEIPIYYKTTYENRAEYNGVIEIYLD